MAAYAVRYSQPLLGSSSPGGALVGVTSATVTVRRNGGATTLYADRAKTPSTNPVPTGVAPGAVGLDTTGNLVFWAEPGDGYDYQVTVSGVTTTVAVPTLSPDPVEPGASAAGDTAIVFGTSLEAQCGAGDTYVVPAAGDSSLGSNGRGWVDYANALLGNRFSIVRSAGVAGNTYANMRTRLSADVLAYSSAWVLMGGPVNDVANGRTVADIQADANFMLDALAGRSVAILTAGPSASYDTTAERTVLAEINAWIRDLPRARRNVYVIDAWKAVADPATGSPATGMAVDGVHWSSHGALRVGQEAYRVLNSVVPIRPHPLFGVLDPAKSAISNPHFGTTGSGWATVDTGITVAYSPDDLTMGNKATMTLSGITTSSHRSVQYVENISGGRFAVGDTVQGMARVRWSNMVPLTSVTGVFAPNLTILQRKVDGTFGTAATALFVASASFVTPPATPILPASGEMVVFTPRVVLEANTDRLYTAVGWRGAASGEVTASEVAFYRV